MFESIQGQATAYSAASAFHPVDEVSPSAKTSQDAEQAEKVTSQQVRTEPGQKQNDFNGKPRDSFELSQEAEEIRQLQKRDREVRAHEAAHAASGGSYAGAPTYTFKRGPDGGSYAVGGEVSIDISPIKGDPEATLQKAQQVRAAALAPAEPSGQDRQVAQQALALAAEARAEIAGKRSESHSDVRGEADSENTQDDSVKQASDRSDSHRSNHAPSSFGLSRLDIKA